MFLKVIDADGVGSVKDYWYCTMCIRGDNDWPWDILAFCNTKNS